MTFLARAFNFDIYFEIFSQSAAALKTGDRLIQKMMDMVFQDVVSPTGLIGILE